MILSGVALSCSGQPLETPTSPTAIAITATAAHEENPADVDPEQAPAHDPSIPPPPVYPSPPSGEAVLIGAGDIALCDSLDRASATARLIDSQLRRGGGIVFTLGDNSNDDGRPEQYANCFASTWGRFDVRPSPGNHDDYDDRHGGNGAAYFEYFGARAGPPHRGYYSYDAGAWHVVSLNSEIMNRGPREDAQLAWLRADLRNAAGRCVLAYFHRPMVSSGEFAAGRMVRLWQVLYAGGTDVIVTGHEHFYERFAQQTPSGELDANFGIRQFIVGTGGAHFHGSIGRARHSQLVIRERLGVIRFTLRPEDYSWEFIDVDGGVLDTGSERCHGRLE